ncbi:MAG TPA: ArsI/CadI family heavy metal resistance metalloenzyme [Dyella sp.]|uniref:ArsI/CadI family heavy metal resistance metalloenzyme n=1 Tax=Dyella sp. TaxID=1869338 RepID=UPI002C5EE716|nr:ArsI/CadI family heavy metal resistance metalloenzyme [Dyella sp.]HTV86202.1 ArsI/CadI family heavy metal resistance metalloenzyme [Dyella sp.]
MKRFHVHVNVQEMESSIRFYSMLFGAQPSVVKSDYAKWMLEDPQVNFAISQRGGEVGVDHLGIQVEQVNELADMGQRLGDADAVVLAEKATTCCYARSDKYWAQDPQGVRWESFYTHGEATTYTTAPEGAATGEASPCCGPQSNVANTTCGPKGAGSCC